MRVGSDQSASTPPSPQRAEAVGPLEPHQITLPLEPAVGSVFDPLVEEVSFSALVMEGADPAPIGSPGAVLAAWRRFSTVLEQGWLPGRAVVLCELANDPLAGRARLRASLLLGVAGPAGSTAADTAEFAGLAKRELEAWPGCWTVEPSTPSRVLASSRLPHRALIVQREVGVEGGTGGARALSRWDREPRSMLPLAEALCARRAPTAIRATFLATELGLDDHTWLRAQLSAATDLAVATGSNDPELAHRAGRAAATLLDTLESYRSPLYVGEVAVLSDAPLSPFWLRGVAVAITNEFDVVNRSVDAPVVAARRRWVGGFEIEPAPQVLAEALALGIPMRGGLGPRRFRDLMSLTEAACALQWPIPTAGPVPTVPVHSRVGLPAPPGLPREGAEVGSLADGEPFFVDAAGRARHVHVIGVTGSGKSTFVDRLISDDLSAGRPLVLIDPHGDLAVRAARRAERVGRRYAYLAPAVPRDVVLDRGEHVRLSLFDVGDGIVSTGRAVGGGATTGGWDDDALSRSVSRLIAAIESTMPKDWVGPRFRQLARMSLMVAAYAGAGFDEACSVLTDGSEVAAICRRAAARGLPSWVLEELRAWHENNGHERMEVAMWVTSKFDELAHSATLPATLAPAGEGLDLRRALDEGLVVLADLSEIDDLEGRLLGHLLLGATIEAAFARPRGGRSLLPVYVDEAERFAFVSNFERGLNEGRKHGLSLLLAHQHLSQLDPRTRDAVLGSCGLRLLFRLAPDDAERFGPRVGLPGRVLADQSDLHAVVEWSSSGRRVPPFTCHLPPPAPIA